MLKLGFIARMAPMLLLLLLSGVNPAKAQGFSAYFGFGTATDSSSNEELECAKASPGCTSGVVTPDVSPKMTGTFGTFGADYMWKPLGLGGEFSWRLSRGPFAPQESVTYRPVFYDLNAIWHPVGKGAHVVPELQGGIGGVITKFYYAESSCLAGVIGCSTLSEYLVSSNHFALHCSAGIRFYVKGNLYLRPQVDVRWVNNFVEFGSDIVPEYTVVIGYTFGKL